MKKITFIILYFWFLNDLLGQNIHIGAGFTGGYKSVYQEQGVYIQSRIFKRIDFSFGYAKSKFNGPGFGTSIGCLILKNKFQPYLGIGYSNNAGNELNVNYKGNSGLYRIHKNEFYYYDVGLIYKYNPDVKENNYDAMLLLSIHFLYRKPLLFNAELIEGYENMKAETWLHKRAGEGLGISATITCLIGRKKKQL